MEALADLTPDWRPQMPTGGASLWVALPTTCATAFAQRAERAGVLILPGPTFSNNDGLDDHIRIAYAGPSSETHRGLELLAATWNTFRDQ